MFRFLALSASLFSYGCMAPNKHSVTLVDPEHPRVTMSEQDGVGMPSPNPAEIEALRGFFELLDHWDNEGEGHGSQ